MFKKKVLLCFFCVSKAECYVSSLCTGINQFNHMALPNAQITPAPMGARAASPMNHPQQINLSSVPAVRRVGDRRSHTDIYKVASDNTCVDNGSNHVNLCISVSNNVTPTSILVNLQVAIGARQILDFTRLGTL